MDNMLYILFVCIFVPLMLSIPLVNKQSRDIVIFVLTGIASALLIAEVNSVVLDIFKNDSYYVTTTITPITEELVKSIPVLMYVYFFEDKRDKYLAIAFALGVGFALFENTYILVEGASKVSLLWAVFRGFSTALMHGICTAAVGYGMSFVRLRRKLAIPGTFALLITAIIYHGIFNIFVQDSQLKYVGFALPLLTYIPLVIHLMISIRKKKAAKSVDR